MSPKNDLLLKHEFRHNRVFAMFSVSKVVVSDFDDFIHIFDISPCAYVPSCMF